VATINWLAIPGSYEVRAIARLIHPQDPDVSEADFARVYWVNLMHDYFHSTGPAPEPGNLPYIACIYYVIEAFDNSPYDPDAPGEKMGLRVLPRL